MSHPSPGQRLRGEQVEQERATRGSHCLLRLASTYMQVMQVALRIRANQPLPPTSCKEHKQRTYGTHMQLTGSHLHLGYISHSSLNLDSQNLNQ